MSPATDSKDCAATAMTMKPSKWRRTIHRRYILAIMSFFGLFHTANLRVNLSCAIVAMTTNYSSLDDDAIVTHVSQPLAIVLYVDCNLDIRRPSMRCFLGQATVEPHH